MSIETDAQKDLALSDEDAENVAGGKMTAKKSAATAPTRPPLFVKQTTVFGPTEVSANSGDDDCAPENGGGTT